MNFINQHIAFDKVLNLVYNVPVVKIRLISNKRLSNKQMIKYLNIKCT